MQKYKLRNGSTIEIGMQDFNKMTVPVKIDGVSTDCNIQEDFGDFGFWFGGQFVYFRDI